MTIDAVIFDLNGTILEDEDEYGRAFNKVLKSVGVTSGLEYPHTTGIGVKANWEQFESKYKFKTDKSIDQLVKETQDAYLSEITEVSIRPGFMEFAERLKEGGIKIALATSNSWEVADKILDRLNLQGFFDDMTTSEEVKYNKPDPDLFLLAADKLGIEREHCLVMEDSPAGITAAKRGGMKVIGIARNEEYAKELESADLVVEGFSEITPQVLDQL